MLISASVDGLKERASFEPRGGTTLGIASTLWSNLETFAKVSACAWPLGTEASTCATATGSVPVLASSDMAARGGDGGGVAQRKEAKVDEVLQVFLAACSALLLLLLQIGTLCSTSRECLLRPLSAVGAMKAELDVRGASYSDFGV